ncbi:hypothetical protein PG997_010931 [Apiospora hydei]|uniref:Cullin N-terminal domain-containing protein n=1 Tax=Apiospora hydei TaxID=1337664 RepID=A0ABR1VLJ3_9PEZI
MAAESSTSTQGQLAPEKIVYACTHIEMVSDRPMVRRIYEQLVKERLTEPLGKIAYLQQYCNACLRRERETDQHRGQLGNWFQMVMQPVWAKRHNCEDRVSLMLMFVKMWSALTDVALLTQLSDSGDRLIYDGFSGFRYWCKIVSRNLNTDEDPDALNRLLDVIVHFYGWFVRQEIERVMTHYQRLRPISQWSMERVWPVANIPTFVTRSNQFHERVRIFREHAQNIKSFQADLLQVYDSLCHAASAWTGELLGPPQHNDMKLEVLLPHIEWSQVMSRSDVKHLAQLIMRVNAESMLFKCQLYQMYQLDDRYREASKTDVKHMLDCIESLEYHSKRLLPFEEKRREAWDKWVEFAKPFAGLLRIQPEEDEHTEYIIVFD